MKRFLTIALASLALATATPPVDANDAHHPRAEAQKTYGTKGVVVTIDKASGKVKLKHEAVAELDWPAMTMFFAVADKALLDGIAVGDKVEFQFANTSDGAPSITRIKAVK